MNLLDMRTVILSYFVSNAICTGVMALLWLQSRRRLGGTGFWLADFFMQVLALALVTLRGVVPDVLSMVVGNGMVIAGTILLYIGLERFVGKSGSQVHNYVLLTAFIIIHTYFTVAQPNLAARNINLSLWLLVICFQCAWLMLRRVDVDMRPMARAAGLVFAGYCLASAIRIGVELVVPPGNDLFKSGSYETLVVMTYQMLFIALTFSLFLMVNRRLLAETMASLTERQRVEAALRLSEEKFSKAFHASPDAILISRLSDGRIVEVNEGFCRLTEYTRQESLAHSSLTLNIWANPQDRDRLIAALQENNSVRDDEFDFSSKSGKPLHCLYSGEIIQLGDEAHILSVVRDISERKQIEENLELETVRLQAQLALHKMMDAPQDQLLDFTLEAIIKATQSRYGFIGLMDKAEEVVTVYAWSKNTMQECGIDSNSMNFPICEAGLWGECVRQRKPVIVNAYDDYPGKKGFPAGHVPIERFLSVPVFDGEVIVATAAAANKASDYVESDSIALTLLVERLWGILRRKKAEEALRESEAQARRLAEENAQLLREINHRVGNNLYLLSIVTAQTPSGKAERKSGT
jgi:PAS domain S-box-containing protein